ncbi:hypothetical protein QA640_45155 (plasmid) [Bradyrhizobium sp. CB82]|uniref:hypothetical protein n=1 Tax=Bradyrhizobium sp. CB82 TaxID=3039159 RepID=UPI0024B21B53|nr:hypothetical protein [Bradyrhizobium sp. CB82]WFU45974.1 hypothetical protein QA640_45155 [Bradyrhizobium sp. CB82]
MTGGRLGPTPRSLVKWAVRLAESSARSSNAAMSARRSDIATGRPRQDAELEERLDKVL